MSEAHIQQMARMGFGRAEAEAALSQAGNDIFVAINLALNGAAGLQQGGGDDARPFTPPAVGVEPEPEPGPEERLIQRSQQYVANGGGGGMIDRLRARRDHQEATLAMLRGAGASEDELKVIKADVEVLKRQVAEYEDNQAAMQAAREAARRAQDELLREREEEQRRAEEARLAREAAAAEAAEQIRLAADAKARAEAEAAAQAAAEEAAAAAAAAVVEAEARQKAADEALAAQVQAELDAAERGQAAEQEATNALTQSTVRTEWRVEVLDAKTIKDGEDGYIFNAPEYTAYDIQVTRPDGTATIITKRYSDFDVLKTKLAVTEEAKQAEIASLDFATWTWTKGGSMHEDTINDRKTKLGSWLNAVLFLCPGSKDVVEFIDGEDGLLASVNDPPPQLQPEPEPEPEQ